MTIRVKYCGGCNPKFERSTAVDLIKEKMPEEEVFYSDTESPCDYVFVICGCTALCADHKDIPYNNAKYIVQSLDETKKSVEEILATIANIQS